MSNDRLYGVPQSISDVTVEKKTKLTILAKEN